MEYLETLDRGEGKTIEDTTTNGRTSEQNMIIDKIETLTDKVERNDKETGELSESFVRIKRGIKEEKSARKSNVKAVTNQLKEIKGNHSEVVANMINVLSNQNKIVNIVQDNQVKMDNYTWDILNSQADQQGYLQDISKNQLEILSSQGELLTMVNASRNRPEV